MALDVQDITCGYHEKIVLDRVTLSVGAGELLCILGPNGTGKTTLFKSMLGFITIKQGRIILDGKDLLSYRRNKIAREIGYVPQSHTPPFPFRVVDVVVMGRAVHLDMFATPGKKEYQIAEDMMAHVGIAHLKEKIYSELSGGERQLVLIARALTQETKLLIMDEPTSNLDFGNQVKVLSYITRLTKQGISVVMTSHFPDHAFLCSSNVAVMCGGTIIAQGSADEVITESLLRKIYGIEVKVAEYVHDGEILKTCIPLL